MKLLPHQDAIVRELEFRPEDALWERKPGQWELNPLLLARIIERIQFDGDACEFRTGNLPEGGKPAVPVTAKTCNPIILGMMLQRASAQVGDELALARQIWEKGAENALAVPDTMPVFGTQGYQAGSVPEPREIAVSPLETRTLTLPQQREVAFTSIASTQGRVSGLRYLETEILTALKEQGLDIDLDTERGALQAQAQWSLEISAPGETNSNFAPLVTAKAVLVRRLLQELPSTHPSILTLEVKPLNAIHERTVGWRAFIYG